MRRSPRNKSAQQTEALQPALATKAFAAPVTASGTSSPLANTPSKKTKAETVTTHEPKTQSSTGIPATEFATAAMSAAKRRRLITEDEKAVCRQIMAELNAGRITVKHP
jgi:hypothetical protein